MKVFIIVPCYNEEKRISNVLERIKKLDLDKKIIVVDDGSSDNTCEILRDNFEDILLLEHSANLGKGAALKTGCEAAIKLGGEVVVFIDADGQHPSEVIPQMIKKLRRDNLDLVFASRKIELSRMPLVFFLGNKFLTNIINFTSGVYLSDSLSGLRAFKLAVYPQLAWKGSGYSVETEMIVNAGKSKLKYGQVMFDTIYLDNYKGTTPFDGIKILFSLFKSKFL